MNATATYKNSPLNVSPPTLRCYVYRERSPICTDMMIPELVARCTRIHCHRRDL
jgi:hypothetical protein